MKYTHPLSIYKLTIHLYRNEKSFQLTSDIKRSSIQHDYRSNILTGVNITYTIKWRPECVDQNVDVMSMDMSIHS